MFYFFFSLIEAQLSPEQNVLAYYENDRHLTYGTQPHPFQTSLMVFHNWDKPVQVFFCFFFALIYQKLYG